MGVAEVRPTVDVGRPEILIFHEGIEDGDVALSTDIPQGFRVARIRVRTLRWNTGVVCSVAEGVVHVPQGVAPLLAASVRVPAAPPRRVPIQPVCAYREGIEQVIVNQAHHVVHAGDVVVVIWIGHVLTGHEVHERHPIRIVPVLDPCTAPSLDEVNEVTRLVVVLGGEVEVIDLFAVFVNTPILAIEVDNATFVGSLVNVQIGQVAQCLHIGIADVATA